MGEATKHTSDRTAQELKLAALALELKRSNADLEQFAYVASHDLQEPLRTISGHLQVISRESKLSPQAREHLNYVVKAAQRLREQIQDLLAYAQVGVQKPEKTHADCEFIFSDAVGRLEESIRESRAILTHGPLPTIPMEPTDFYLLLQNLLTNALKYRRPGITPTIEVKAVRRDRYWLFSVADNGIGIPREQLGNLFILFKRLHDKNEFPGTGIGLAMARKICELYGGTIWVESELGVGSTFYFTIPTADEGL